MRVSYVIVFVSDMQRSVEFYRDVLRLPLKFESPEWSEFAPDGATVALHASDERGADQEHTEHPHAGRCRPGFGVKDLDEFHQRMTACGVPCVQEPKNVFGARLAQYLDPDGLAFSVGQDH